MRDQAATCPFVGFWPRVGKAAVVLHAVENRTIDLYSIALLATPRIEIPIDGADSPGPDGGYVATGASWPSPTLRLAALSPRIWGKISRWKNPPTPSPSLSSDPLRSFMTWSQMSLGWVNGVPSANTAGGTMGIQPVWAPGSLVTTNHLNVYGTHALRSSLLSGVESSHFSSVRRGFVGATRLFPKRAVAPCSLNLGTSAPPVSRGFTRGMEQMLPRRSLIESRPLTKGFQRPLAQSSVRRRRNEFANTTTRCRPSGITGCRFGRVSSGIALTTRRACEDGARGG